MQVQQQIKISSLLRSSKYKQIRHRWSDREDGRCVLGAIYSELGWSGDIDMKGVEPFERVTEPIRRKFFDRYHNTIIYYNDGLGYSFEKIADMIEAVENDALPLLPERVL